MRARLASDLQRQVEHLIEVAVVDIALPVHGQQRAAHHRFQVGFQVGVLEQAHITAELALGNQRAAETLDRHIGEGVESVEVHAIILAKVAVVVFFEFRLSRRQRRALRVVHQIERLAAVWFAVAQRVEALQGADAGLEHAVTALAVDVVFQITR